MCDWEDVTGAFKRSCAALPLGELVRDPRLSLHDALQAIELMDPRMDAGMDVNLTAVNTLQDALDNGLKVDDFSEAEQIGLMDQMFNLLALWYRGNNAGQTVLTCMYMHDPRVLKCKELQIFFEGMLHLVQATQTICLQASCCEEEDFVTSLYGFDMCSWKPFAAVLADINATMKTQPENVAHRMRLLFHLLSAMQQYLKFNAIPNGLRMATHALSDLDACLATLEAGADVSSGERDSALQPTINGHLLAATPLREIESITTQQAYEYLRHEIVCIKTGMHIFSCRTLHALHQFFGRFARMGAGAFARSVVHRCFLNKNKWAGKIDPGQAVREDVYNWCGYAIMAPGYKPTRGAEQLSAFVGVAVEFEENTVAIACQNRPRQRRRLAKVFTSAATLSSLATQVDVTHLGAEKPSQHHPLTAWAGRRACIAGLEFLMLGLELQLHAQWELLSVFWYMRHVAGWLLTIETRAFTQLREAAEAQAASTSAAGGGGAAKKKKGKGKQKKQKQLEPPDSWRLADAWSAFADAYTLALVACDRLGRAPPPPPPLVDPRIVFEHRFAPFQDVVIPYPASYDLFCSKIADLDHLNADELFEMAANAFGKAASDISTFKTRSSEAEPQSRLDALQRVAQRNKIVCTIATKSFADKPGSVVLKFTDDKVMPVIDLS